MISSGRRPSIKTLSLFHLESIDFEIVVPYRTVPPTCTVRTVRTVLLVWYVYRTYRSQPDYYFFVVAIAKSKDKKKSKAQ